MSGKTADELAEIGQETKFSSTNQPPNRGRKPKVFSELSKDFQARGIEKATPEAVKEAYEYLLALTLQEIDDIAGTLSDKTNDYPVLLRAAAKELKGKRTIEILREMLDRAHGKAKQGIEIAGPKGGPVKFEGWTLEDKLAAKALIDRNKKDGV